MGKKKDKLYKLEPETKAMIAAVRSAVEDCAATGLYGRFMGFEESHTTDDYRLTAVFDCGEYRLRLRYLPSVMLLTDNFLDIDLDYGDAGRFTLYDVFNVLEIEDFNQYYHSGFSTTGEVPGLVRELLEVVHKYDYDLRRAAEPQLLAQMKANRLADMKAVRGKHFDPNDPDGEDQEILGILPTHPMVTAVSGATDSAKLLRHLEKAEAKGRLDTLYERRLLDYMRRGNTVVDQTEQAKQDFERQYKRCARKVNGIIAIVGLIVAMVLVFGLRALLFRGTRLVEYTLPIGGLEISVSTAKCVALGLVSAIGMFSTGKVLLGTPLMKRFYPKDEKSRAYYARENESARTGKQVAEAVVGMLLMVLLSVYAATNNFGIGGEYVRYSPDGSLFQVVQVENRDLRIYKVEGETDEDGVFAPVENGYAISDGKDHSYYVGELVPGGPTEKKLLAIAEKNGQTIPTVKTQEDNHTDGQDPRGY